MGMEKGGRCAFGSPRATLGHGARAHAFFIR